MTEGLGFSKKFTLMPIFCGATYLNAPADWTQVSTRCPVRRRWSQQTPNRVRNKRAVLSRTGSQIDFQSARWLKVEIALQLRPID
jgi:hypothetical protein